MILYGTNLVQTIRAEFDKAEKRIYIAVPFIGDWNAVKKIMGTNWISNNGLEMKVLTDIGNDGFINGETIKHFLHRGQIRTLAGLHAKIYIADNSVFITSANLTATAFSKRYEICDFFKISDSHEITDVFEQWWKKGKKVESSWQPDPRRGQSESEAGNISGLKKLWDLPQSDINVLNFKDYQNNIILFNHFLHIYLEDKERLIPDLNVYHELDAFLNYLFHEDINKPSYEYLIKKSRILSDYERLSELRKYKRKFKVFLEKNTEFESYRKDRILLVQEKLDIQEIDLMDSKSLAEVTGVLHTMNSLALNRFRFLNPQNNNLKTVKKTFKILLHGNGPIEERMELCNQSLRYFGKSSIKELVAWYFPDKYPIMNRNTNSGLKFFGYDIDTY